MGYTAGMKPILHSRRRLAVIDDDPTGIQTIHGCLALTRWSPEAVEKALKDKFFFFYILTNTRALPADAARERICSAVRVVEAEAEKLGVEVIYLLRSDSTLRGHFPLEQETVVEETGRAPGLRLFIPAFFEAGRITEGNVHYLVQDGERIPCDRTEFARDSVFGYATSVLPDYIAEKYGGPDKAPPVSCLETDLLRSGEAEAVVRTLAAVPPGGYLVVNAASYRDLDLFTAALALYLERDPGRRLIIQSSSSFVKSITGTKDAPLIRGDGGGPGTEGRPGLIIVGSHVKKTTAQLRVLLAEGEGLYPCELELERIAEDGKATEEYRREVLGRLAAAFNAGKTPVVFTPRQESRFADAGSRLRAGIRISLFLSSLAAGAGFSPSFLISKGGITSHDILERGLSVASARVLGQAAPGVPALRMPDGHRWAGMPYIIFPGNVGSDSSLLEVYRRMGGQTTY